MPVTSRVAQIKTENSNAFSLPPPLSETPINASADLGVPVGASGREYGRGVSLAVLLAASWLK